MPEKPKVTKTKTAIKQEPYSLSDPSGLNHYSSMRFCVTWRHSIIALSAELHSLLQPQAEGVVSIPNALLLSGSSVVAQLGAVRSAGSRALFAE